MLKRKIILLASSLLLLASCGDSSNNGNPFNINGNGNGNPFANISQTNNNNNGSTSQSNPFAPTTNSSYNYNPYSYNYNSTQQNQNKAGYVFEGVKDGITCTLSIYGDNTFLMSMEGYDSGVYITAKYSGSYSVNGSSLALNANKYEVYSGGSLAYSENRSYTMTGTVGDTIYINDLQITLSYKEAINGGYNNNGNNNNNNSIDVDNKYFNDSTGNAHLGFYNGNQVILYYQIDSESYSQATGTYYVSGNTIYMSFTQSEAYYNGQHQTVNSNQSITATLNGNALTLYNAADGSSETMTYGGTMY